MIKVPVRAAPPRPARPQSDTQPCPNCGHDMPALKGARWAVCPTCGYKESCCY